MCLSGYHDTNDETSIMQISIRSDIKRTLKDFKDIRQKSIPYAISQAINDTLFDLRKELPKEMRSVFDEPVSFTTADKAWDVDKAEPKKAIGVIKLRRAQASYLKWPIRGGVQRPKGKAIPVAQKKGKLTAAHGGLIQDWSERLEDKKTYFSGTPTGGRPGIYRRLGKRRWSKRKKEMIGQKIRLEVGWEKRSDYKEGMWDFYESTHGYVQRNFAKNFRRRLQKAREYQQSKGISR